MAATDQSAGEAKVGLMSRFHVRFEPVGFVCSTTGKAKSNKRFQQRLKFCIMSTGLGSSFILVRVAAKESMP